VPSIDYSKAGKNKWTSFAFTEWPLTLLTKNVFQRKTALSR
jgi:hypothetical protein